MLGPSSDHVTYGQDYRLTGAPFKSACSRQSNKTSVPWENATSPSSPCSSWSGWNNICPVVVPCAVARNRIGRRWRVPSSPRRCSKSTLPGRCASAWPTTGRYAVCAAGRVSASLPSEATFSRALAEFAEGALPSRLHEALITDTTAGEVGRLESSCTRRESAMFAWADEGGARMPHQPAKLPSPVSGYRRFAGRSTQGRVVSKEPSRLERPPWR